MAFFWGAFGSLLVIAVFCAGAALGWIARGKTAQRSEKKDSEAELRAKERAEAIRAMEAYSAATAYGIEDGGGLGG